MTRERLRDRRFSETFTLELHGLRYVASFSRFDDGRVAEVFLQNHKSASQSDANARDSAIAASLALQHGCSLETLRRALLRDPSGRASTPLGAAHRRDRRAAPMNDAPKPRRGKIISLDPRLLDPRDPMKAARALVRTYFMNDEHRLLYRHRGTFWGFRENHYVLADQETVRADVWRFLEGAQQRDKKGKPVPFKPNRARVSDVLDALNSVCSLDNLTDPPTWLNGAEELPDAREMFPVANGLLHLPSGELYPPTPDYFGLTASDVVFDPDAPEPKHWLAFLKDLWNQDAEAIVTLQDWFGYTLSPDTSQQKILFIVGPRRSGKGTIARVQTALVGRDSVVNPTLASLQTTFGLAPLIGKSLAFITDARLGGRSDQAAITERLLSISGEDALTIDRKHIPAWTGRLRTRFTILTNELPRISDTSGALVGRLIVLVLVQSFFGREDPALTTRLLTELPGILNWALVGYRRLRERGYFIQPVSAREAVEDLELLASPTKAFLNERCHVGPGQRVAVELLFQTWRTWCDSIGRKESGTKQTFGRDLKAVIPSLRIIRPRKGDDRYREYEGIALKEDDQRNHNADA